jgi:hypothetical protein
MEPEGSLPHSQEPATYSELYQSSPCPHPTSWRSIFILSSHERLGLPSGLRPSSCPTKILYAPLPPPPPYVLDASPTLFLLIWSPGLYLAMSTDHWVPRYAVFSTPLVISSLLGPNILLRTLFSNTHSLSLTLHPYLISVALKSALDGPWPVGIGCFFSGIKRPQRKTHFHMVLTLSLCEEFYFHHTIRSGHTSWLIQ